MWEIITQPKCCFEGSKRKKSTGEKKKRKGAKRSVPVPTYKSVSF
jgi:hypothetical protein